MCALKLMKWVFMFKRACAACWQTCAFICHLLKEICDVAIIATYLAGHMRVQLESIIQLAMSGVRQHLSRAAKRKQKVQDEKKRKVGELMRT